MKKNLVGLKNLQRMLIKVKNYFSTHLEQALKLIILKLIIKLKQVINYGYGNHLHINTYQTVSYVRYKITT